MPYIRNEEVHLLVNPVSAYIQIKEVRDHS
jgi:hypothetical protein